MSRTRPLVRRWKQALTLVGAVALLVAGLLIALYSEDIYRDRLRSDLVSQARVLAATKPAQPPRLFFLSRDMQAVTAGDSCAGLVHAPLIGFLRLRS